MTQAMLSACSAKTDSRAAQSLYSMTRVSLAKASGMPLTHELRQLGIPVVNFTPSKGNDKVTRVHSVSPLFESGMIWAPDERWADEVMDECAAFPFGEHDDLVDSSTQALIRFRQGGFVSLFSDELEEPFDDRKRAEYY